MITAIKAQTNKIVIIILELLFMTQNNTANRKKPPNINNLGSGG
ncbi:hypothetical protein PSM_A0087 [Pseudoalteromonas sp. SM9913]|nr:hypothetical protein PSM_A0087 [Pseudoalteromonas sp. SM9913]